MLRKKFLFIVLFLFLLGSNIMFLISSLDRGITKTYEQLSIDQMVNTVNDMTILTNYHWQGMEYSEVMNALNDIVSRYPEKRNSFFEKKSADGIIIFGEIAFCFKNRILDKVSTDFCD